MSRPEIEIRRRELDAIDAEMLALLERRVRIVLEIGHLKASEGLAIFDRQREERILQRLEDLTQPPLDGPAIDRIFRQILEESRRLEQKTSPDPEGE